MKRILVVAPHLDDEAFGIGGSLAKWKAEGKEIHLMFLCKGRDLQNSIDRILANEKIITELNIGRTVLQYEDLSLEQEKLSNITRAIELIINWFEPDTVLTCSEYDLHQDHQITNRAVRIAARPSRSLVKEIYEFKIPGSALYQNVYYDTLHDISEYVELKQKLMNYYETENIPECKHIEYFRTIYREL